MMKRLWLAALAAAIWTGGCARPETSGFMAPYTDFKKPNIFSSDLVYTRPDVDWDKYTKVRIAAVVVYVHPDADPYRGISAEEIQRLTQLFTDKLHESFSAKYTVTNTAGPDVLDVRTAITRLAPTNRSAAAASWFIPGSSYVSSGYTALTNKSLTMGEAAVEAEFVDSTSGERLYGYVARHIGSSIEIKQITPWGIAEKWLGLWAAFLPQKLDYLQHPQKEKEVPLKEKLEQEIKEKL